ncbi:hypothetical protein E1176_04350 [Fulvivirga sp. RKSG066]|uniref:hypothetical protein n=1 Tax=Fulvivirga aurantia TaxID=2529383 RepID=UPI0012BC054F|nr:hypothetical protein [Fulvivirga aurantia]MTI20243.1 hypothetical protein [Fulvivirga aurantia]
MVAFFIFTANIGFISLLIYWLYKYEDASPIKAWFFPALFLKLAAGIGLGLIYGFHYEYGDTLNYYREGAKFAALAEQNISTYISELFTAETAHFDSKYDRHPRALFTAKITSVFVLITNQNYWLSSLYFSLFSFFGFWKLAVCASKIFDNKLAVLLSLLFYPSVVFWSAGIAKESFAMGSFAYILATALSIIYLKDRLQARSVLLNLLFFVLLWKLKYYYAGALILVGSAAIGIYYITNKAAIIKKSWFFKILITLSLCTVIIIGVSYTSPNLNLDRVAEVVHKNHVIIVNKTEPEELVRVDDLEPTWTSLVKNAPLALWTGLFRPLPGDGDGVLNFLVVIENLILLFLAISAMTSIWKVRKLEYKYLFFSGLAYCFILAIFLTLSTPNFGTLVRYKVGFLPVFLMLVTVPNPLIKKLNNWVFSK